MPGGAATAGALRFKLLHASGVSGPDAAFAAAVQGVGSAVVLNVLLWTGLVVSIPLRGFDPLYTAAAAVGAVLVTAGVLAVLLLTRGQESSVRTVRAVARRLPLITEDTAERFVRTAATRLVELARDRRMLTQAVLWATLNWLLDAAALWVFVQAYGYRLGLDGLIVAFGLANVVAALPITPGGLGLVEGVLVPTIVGFGAPRGIAVLGVVSYRLVNFWLPIPVAALAYVSLRGGQANPAPAVGGPGQALTRRSTRDSTAAAGRCRRRRGCRAAARRRPSRGRPGRPASRRRCRAPAARCGRAGG